MPQNEQELLRVEFADHRPRLTMFKHARDEGVPRTQFIRPVSFGVHHIEFLDVPLGEHHGLRMFYQEGSSSSKFEMRGAAACHELTIVVAEAEPKDVDIRILEGAQAEFETGEFAVGRGKPFHSRLIIPFTVGEVTMLMDRAE